MNHRTPFLLTAATLTMTALGAPFLLLTAETPPSPSSVASVPLPDRARCPAAGTVEPAGPDSRARAARRLQELDVGERVRLASNIRLSIATRHEDRRATDVQVTADGEFTLHCVATQGDTRALCVAMPAARCATRAGGELVPDDRLAHDLAAGCIVRLERDGTVSGYRFPPATDPRHRNLLRTWFASTRVPLPDGNATTWSATEATASGPCRLQFRRDGDAGHVRVSWQRDAVGSQPDPGCELCGRGELTAGATLPWWTSATADETHTVVVPVAGVRIEARFDAAHRLVAVERAEVDPAFAWDAPWASVDGAEEAAETAAFAERCEWEARLRGASLELEVDRLAAAIAAGEAGGDALMASRERLMWLLRLSPRHIAAVAAQVVDGACDEALAANLAAVLANVGGDAAQTALLEATDRVAPGSARQLGCLRACFQIEQANAATVAAAIRYSAGRDQPAVADTALLLLGACAATAADRAAPLAALLAQEGTAEAEGRIETWLLALGNTGRDEVLPIVGVRVSSPEPQLRAAALAALRRLDRPAAFDLLASHARHDADPGVRQQALLTLVDQSHPGVRAAVLAAFGDVDEDVRLAAVQAIVLRDEVGSCRAELAALRDRDASPRVRAEAEAALSAVVARS